MSKEVVNRLRFPLKGFKPPVSNVLSSINIKKKKKEIWKTLA